MFFNDVEILRLRAAPNSGFGIQAVANHGADEGWEVDEGCLLLAQFWISRWASRTSNHRRVKYDGLYLVLVEFQGFGRFSAPEW